jgi:hypothetical protein
VKARRARGRRDTGSGERTRVRYPHKADIRNVQGLSAREGGRAGGPSEGVDARGKYRKY